MASLFVMVYRSLPQRAASLLSKFQGQQAELITEAEDITTLARKWVSAGQDIVQSWSGSFCGYHSELYFGDFERPPLQSRFSVEWGGLHGLPEGWSARTEDEVKTKMRAVAGIELEGLETRTATLVSTVTELREELVTELFGIHQEVGLPKQKEILEKLEKFEWGSSRGKYIRDNTPKNFGTRDSEAINQGIKLPAHIFYEAVAAECCSRCASAQEFFRLSLRLLRTIEMPPNLVAEMGLRDATKKVFIGHGRSLLWLKLRILLKEKLQLECLEFNEEPIAGVATTTRLQTMLNEAQFAFLVMTSEDPHADGSLHSRENVIHEAGLFQGRLGFGRAIILLEEGCSEFSNIHGLGQIRFPKGNIDASFEQIREVLKRESII